MEYASEEFAFPKLTPREMELVRRAGGRREYADGDFIFRAGDADIAFHVVESGRMEILNPTAGNAHVAFHDPGEFAGDIDLLTQRPVIVTGVARGPTVLTSVPGPEFRDLLGTVPTLGEKLLVAMAHRRILLARAGVIGLKVLGPSHDPDTVLTREFLYKNFVPCTWYDTDEDEGRRELAAVNKAEADAPVIVCGDGTVLAHPDLPGLAKCAGLRRRCPDQVFDLAVVGAGPAGITSAVYAASEALKTVVVDRLGPGGQAGGSSLIENFIGFPSGLSGTELATRGVLQMMKFGALLLTPVQVERVELGDAHHVLHTAAGERVRARVLLAATGVRWRRLEAKNARRYERAGIFYAATSVESRVCTGEEIAVVGGGNSAGQAAMFLSECARRVHMLIRGSDLAKGMSEYLVHRIRSNEKITVHTRTEVTEVFGDGERISGIEVACHANGEAGEAGGGDRRRVPITSLFVFIGAEPHADWLPQGVARNDRGYVLCGVDAQRSGRWPLDRDPCALETTVPRLLAAGDLRAGSTKRVGFAVGDGSLAVTCTHQLLGMQQQ